MSRGILLLSDPKRGCSTAKRQKKQEKASPDFFWDILRTFKAKAEEDLSVPVKS